MSATTQHPKIFISYSWTNPEHEQFVIELATTLRGHGIDAVLDKWDLKPGQDKYVFMESMVVDPTVGRVLVICDRQYQEKANARAGGVGTESQIISQELYGKVAQTKFIPVVCEHDDEGQACLPVFMKSLIYIDMSTDERYGEGLDELLRLIYEQPLYQKPKLGAPPAFVAKSGASFVRELPAALRAIRDGKPNRQGLETQYIKALVTELSKLYSQPTGDSYYEEVYQSIVATKALRDQLAEYVDVVAAFSNDDTGYLSPFINFMNEVGSRFGPPAESGAYYSEWGDFYGFIGLEAMLLQTAALLRHDRWQSLRRLLSATYLVHGGRGDPEPRNFVVFDFTLNAIDEHRNRALKLNRASLSADMLKERCVLETCSFGEMEQADVFLTLRSVVDSGVTAREEWPPYWAPRTSVYARGNKHPVFMRANDDDVRVGLWAALGVKSASELKSRLEASGKRLDGFRLLSNNRAFSRFNFLEAINMPALVK